ncbi:phosphate ABC transporter substrate-binding protein PstS [Kitasatospora cineracea]|uniref:phosphate ABC transporter substrate-binding protein PstS n=1 Tax=Kitasatospora cineracea TaxID=88074 RepID=UPI003414333A
MARKAIAALAALAAALTVAGCTTQSGSGPSVATASPSAGVGFGRQLCDRAVLEHPGYNNAPAPLPHPAQRLTGAGSSFVAPIMADWSAAYTASRVDYQSVGSGAGVQRITARQVDFGASDTPMADGELAKAGTGVLHVPLVLGAVVPAYNVRGVPAGLKFDGPTLGKIFTGRITSWSDPALKALNPDADLPDEPITTVHRSDGSGTTAVWADYLTKTSPDWTTALGGPSRSTGKDIAWPTGAAGKGNEGVTEKIHNTEGALGYLELSYALDTHLPYGQVRNRTGRFVQPCPATITLGVARQPLPADLRTSFTDGPDQDAYPITGTTYALLPQDQKDPAKAAALVDFLAWTLTTGQDQAARLHYAPLDPSLQSQSLAKLKTLTLNGTPLFP